MRVDHVCDYMPLYVATGSEVNRKWQKTATIGKRPVDSRTWPDKTALTGRLGKPPAVRLGEAQEQYLSGLLLGVTGP